MKVLPATARSLIEKAANDPNLTLENGALALMRFTLLKCNENPDEVQVREVAEVITGVAKMLESGGGGQNADAELKAFLYGEKV